MRKRRCRDDRSQKLFHDKSSEELLKSEPGGANGSAIFTERGDGNIKTVTQAGRKVLREVAAETGIEEIAFGALSPGEDERIGTVHLDKQTGGKGFVSGRAVKEPDGMTVSCRRGLVDLTGALPLLAGTELFRTADQSASSRIGFQTAGLPAGAGTEAARNIKMTDMPGRTVGTADDALTVGNDSGADPDSDPDHDYIRNSGVRAENVFPPDRGGVGGKQQDRDSEKAPHFRLYRNACAARHSQIAGGEQFPGFRPDNSGNGNADAVKPGTALSRRGKRGVDKADDGIAERFRAAPRRRRYFLFMKHFERVIAQDESPRFPAECESGDNPVVRIEFEKRSLAAGTVGLRTAAAENSFFDQIVYDPADGSPGEAGGVVQ